MWVFNGLVELDGNCVVGCGFATDLLCWTVTVPWDVGVKLIGLVEL
jgi:hypothetical protein